VVKVGKSSHWSSIMVVYPHSLESSDPAIVLEKHVDMVDLDVPCSRKLSARKDSIARWFLVLHQTIAEALDAAQPCHSHQISQKHQ
jgi:hypothetical protein